MLSIYLGGGGAHRCGISLSYILYFLFFSFCYCLYVYIFFFYLLFLFFLLRWTVGKMVFRIFTRVLYGASRDESLVQHGGEYISSIYFFSKVVLLL